MAIKIEIPWEKYGTIACLAEKCQGSTLGKTVLQKLVYFLQEWKNVPVGYNFDLYTYGPFSADLLGDLDYTQSLGAVNIEYIINGGYSISPSLQNQEVQDRASDFLRKYETDIEEVVRLFGKCAAWQLELRATIHFAYQEMQTRGASFTDDDIVNTLHSVKPGKFTGEQIKQAINELRENGVIDSCNVC